MSRKRESMIATSTLGQSGNDTTSRTGGVRGSLTTAGPR